jgi:hypothetical protein
MFSALSGSINVLIFIAGLLLSLMIVYLYIKFYEPYFFPNLAYSKDVNKVIKTNDTIKQNLLLIKGIMNVKETDEISFTGAPYNKNNNNYIPFLSSINMDGGNQYTISFWMNYKKKEDVNNDDFILLSKHNNCKEKCNYSPEIKVTSNGYFEVKYVNNEGDNTIPFKDDNTEDNKSNGILDKRNQDSWYLYTFVFKDYRDVLHQNIVGHQVMLYINDILYKRHTIEGKVIKVHHNDLKILPDNNDDDDEKTYYKTNKTETDNESKIADVRYINYALSHNDIVKMYRKGFNNEVFKTYFQLNKGFSRQNINVIRLQSQLSG